MSIMRLESVPYGTIDSRYITSVDTVVQNLGPDAFDVLMQVYHDNNPYYAVIHHVPPYGSVALPGMETHQVAFSILLVTNINSYTTTGVTVYAKLQGAVVAVFSQENFHRLN